MKKSKLILSMIDAYNMVLLDAYHYCQNKPDSRHKTDYGYFNVDNVTYAIRADVVKTSIWLELSRDDDPEHPFICIDRQSASDSRIITEFIKTIKHIDNYWEYECEKSVESMESPMIAKDLKNLLKDIPDETRIILCHELVGNEHEAEYVEYKDGAIRIHEARI